MSPCRAPTPGEQGNWLQGGFPDSGSLGGGGGGEGGYSSRDGPVVAIVLQAQLLLSLVFNLTWREKNCIYDIFCIPTPIPVYQYELRHMRRPSAAFACGDCGCRVIFVSLLWLENLWFFFFS